MHILYQNQKTSFAIDKHSYMQFRLNNFAYSKWASYRRDKASLTNKGLIFFLHIIVLMNRVREWVHVLSSKTPQSFK